MMDYNAPGWLILIAEAYAIHEPWLKSRFNDYGELFGTASHLARCCEPRTTSRPCAGGACCAWRWPMPWPISMS